MPNMRQVVNIGVAWYLLIYCLCTVPTFLAGLVIGGYHIKDCPIDQRLPVWAVIFGSIGLTADLFVIVVAIIIIQRRHREADSYINMLAIVFITSILSFLFSLAWGIVGIVWSFELNRLNDYQSTLSATDCNVHVIGYARGIPWFAITQPLGLLFYLICTHFIRPKNRRN